MQMFLTVTKPFNKVSDLGETVAAASGVFCCVYAE